MRLSSGAASTASSLWPMKCTKIIFIRMEPNSYLSERLFYLPNQFFFLVDFVLCQVAHDLGAFEGSKKLQLASFHTISKGFVGECGFRGGYCEFLGIPADVQAQIIKLSSINLCPNTMGQVMVGLMSNPPKPGDPSHEQYVAERDAIKDSLKTRANKLSKALNAIDGMSCTDIEGAMYAFPSIHMPGKPTWTYMHYL